MGARTVMAPKDEILVHSTHVHHRRLSTFYNREDCLNSWIYEELFLLPSLLQQLVTPDGSVSKRMLSAASFRIFLQSPASWICFLHL